MRLTCAAGSRSDAGDSSRAECPRVPRVDADPHAVPVATRVFSRTERLVFRIPADADRQPVVSATLMSRSGLAMRTLAVTREAGRDGMHQVDLPLAGLASADYVI